MFCTYPCTVMSLIYVKYEKCLDFFFKKQNNLIYKFNKKLTDEFHYKSFDSLFKMKLVFIFVRIREN